MSKAKAIHLIYGCIVSVLVILLGAALIESSLHIYHSDPTGDPYNPQSIAAHYRNIAVWVYVTLGAIAGGAVLKLVLPVDREKTHPIRYDWQIMQKAARKAGPLSAELAYGVRKEVILRSLITAGCVVFFVGLMVYPALYLFLWANFTVENATQDILKASLLVLIPSVIGLGVCHLCSTLICKSLRRQTAIYKSASGGAASPLPVKNHKSAIIAIRCVIAVVAIVFITLGTFNGSAKDVLAKAVKICTECIGLG